MSAIPTIYFYLQNPLAVNFRGPSKSFGRHTFGSGIKLRMLEGLNKDISLNECFLKPLWFPFSFPEKLPECGYSFENPFEIA